MVSLSQTLKVPEERLKQGFNRLAERRVKEREKVECGSEKVLTFETNFLLTYLGTSGFW